MIYSKFNPKLTLDERLILLIRSIKSAAIMLFLLWMFFNSKYFTGSFFSNRLSDNASSICLFCSANSFI